MKIKRAAVRVFFVVLLMAGLLTCADYGLPCDEPAEQVILQENMHEYAIRLLGEDSPAAQWYASRGINRISASIEKDHGQCGYYAFVPVLARSIDQPDVLTVWWHAYTWLWFMAGVIAIYGFCRETGLTRPVSCMGSLLLYLCPRFFAEGHYNNKDMVLLSLVLLTLWMGVRFLHKPTLKRGMLFSLFGAMATNTKVAGIFPWGVMGLCAVVLVTAQKKWSRRMGFVAAGTVGMFAAFYLLLTPAAWADPLGYLEYLLINASAFTRWPGVVVFRGMVFEHAVNPLPRYYLIWMMIVTLPVYVIPLAACGQLEALARVWKQKTKALADPDSLALTAVSLCWFVPLFAAVLMRPLVYNGWRHFYFTYAGVALLAAHGIGAGMRFLRNRCSDCGMHRVFALGLCLCFAWMAWGIAQNHPNQYGYYNRLGRANSETDMELDYWDVSTVGAMEALLEHERDESLPLLLGARDDMSWFGVHHGYNVLSPENKAVLTIGENADAPYLFYNTTYARIYGVDAPEGYHELLTIRSYGQRLCTIYEKDTQ